MENRNREDRDPERQPLTNESAMGRENGPRGRRPRPSGGQGNGQGGGQRGGGGYSGGGQRSSG
ncbi:MAG TPA: hypothetical protein VK147_02605, partial [Candidatus Didemnitutus sp.]|nr:hypothetical protein [Candidatus Didemnitutus sp.]